MAKSDLIPPVKNGQSGSSLWIKKDNSWWNVQSEDADPETGWRDGPWGAYAPFESIITADYDIFPDIYVPDGTIVRATVEVVRVP